MIIDSDIDEIISFLKKKKEEGYRSVEIIDNVRASGWCSLSPAIKFVVNKQEPGVLGIDVRNRN